MKNLHPSMKQYAVNRRNFLIGAAAFSGLAMTGQLPSQTQTGPRVFPPILSPSAWLQAIRCPMVSCYGRGWRQIRSMAAGCLPTHS